MLNKIINSKSKTFLALCFCFLAGILVVSILDFRIEPTYLYFSLFIILSFIIYFWSNKKILFVFLGIFFLVLGLFRYQLVFPSQEIKIGKVEFTAFISAEPDVRTDGVRYIVETHNNASIHGKVYLKEPLYPRYNYGDQLKIKCDLEKPEPIEDFRYDMYLARYGVFVICQNTKIEKVGIDSSASVQIKQGNFLFKNIFSLKNVVAGRINQLWHEPHASFMAGLLYGYRGGLGSLNELFNRTGVTHIVAISGYNITIIASILIAICLHLYIPRKKAFWVITIGIILFVLFAGASASVVRAGIMGIIVLLAKQVGRLSRVGNVLALSAVLMALQNPLVLVWDAGFQLSFIATMGLIYLTPLINSVIPAKAGIQSLAISGSLIKSGMTILQESAVSTFSAIIATLPLILFQFGRLSVVAPLVNMLILWLIPILMFGGFTAVLLSFLFFPLGQVTAWLSWVGLKYITTIVEWFASLKFAAVDVSLPWWGMVVMYIFMIYWVIKFTKSTKFSKL